MVQILSLTLFEKTPILQVFDEAKMTNQQIDDANPLPLLDFKPDSTDLKSKNPLLRLYSSPCLRASVVKQKL